MLFENACCGERPRERLDSLAEKVRSVPHGSNQTFQQKPGREMGLSRRDLDIHDIHERDPQAF